MRSECPGTYVRVRVCVILFWPLWLVRLCHGCPAVPWSAPASVSFPSPTAAGGCHVRLPFTCGGCLIARTVLQRCTSLVYSSRQMTSMKSLPQNLHHQTLTCLVISNESRNGRRRSSVNRRNWNRKKWVKFDNYNNKKNIYILSFVLM